MNNNPLEKWDSLIDSYATKKGIDPNLVRQVIMKESSGNPNAISPTGASGIAQFTKATAKDYGLSPDDRFDPNKAIPAMIDKLAADNKYFKGDNQKTLYAYNQGRHAADQVWAGKRAIAPEGGAYIADKRFSQWTGTTNPNINEGLASNPVGQLQQPTQEPLQGVNLLTAGGRVGQPQQQPTSAPINVLPDQLQAVQDARSLYAQQQQDQENQKRRDLTNFAIEGLGAFIAGKNKGRSESVQSAPHSVGSNWSEETQNILSSLGQFRNPTAYFNQRGGF